MVSRQQVLASNALLPSTLPHRLVAVFAGATTGIGLATLKSLVNYTVAPRIYLLARNTASAERVVAECKTIKLDAEFVIVKADLSSVRETDRACEVVKNNEKMVNLIVLSMGEIRMDRALSSEGLHLFLATVYYNRIRIPQNLLPLLIHAGTTSYLARVIDVAGGTKEGWIDTSDLAALRIPFYRIRGHLTSMHTLALESLAEQAHQTVSFVHVFPGSVITPLFDDIPGMRMLGRVKWLFERWLCVPIEECGERHVFMSTSMKYAPARGKATGVDLIHGVETSDPTEGVRGSVYSVDWDCEGPSHRVKELLKKMRKLGIRETVWEHTNEAFEKATSVEYQRKTA